MRMKDGFLRVLPAHKTRNKPEYEKEHLDNKTRLRRKIANKYETPYNVMLRLSKHLAAPITTDTMD